MRVAAAVLNFLGLSRQTALPALATALATSFLSLMACVSLPAIIFAGDLSAYLPIGIGVAFFATVVIGGIVALRSTYPGALAYTQAESAVIVALITASLGTTLAADGRSQQLLPTLLATLAIGGVVSGGFLFFLGYFRLGNLIRYIPFPVMGGFLAGIGWMLIKASIGFAAGLPTRIDTLASLLTPDALLRWMPAMAAGGTLWWLQRNRPHAANLPGVLGGTALLFWIVATASGLTQIDLDLQGWLLPGGNASGRLWPPPVPLSAFGDVAWDLLPAHIPTFATLAVLSAVVLLMNASAIEIATRRDMNFSHELRWIGAANVVGGLGGGWPGYFALGGSVLAYRLKAPIRFVGVLTALVCLVALLGGAPVLAYIPRMAGAALIMFIGIGFLVEWLYGSWLRMERADMAVLLLVFGTVVVAGLVEAIAIGTAAGVALFVVRYSQTGVLRNVLSGSSYRSQVDRAPALQAVLRETGDQIVILRLQGFVFFGTGNSLVSFVRARFERLDAAPLRYLIFDFRLVTGMDASAAVSFTKLSQYAEDLGFTMVLCRPSEAVAALLRKERVDEAVNPRVRVFADLDHGLEWAEDDLLARHVAALAGTTSLTTLLPDIVATPGDAGRLRRYFETVTCAPGEMLIRQGAASDDMFLIESGRVTVRLDLADGSSVRLRSMGAGTIVGEIAFYLGAARSASVVAVEPTVAQRLSSERLAAMQRDDPALATAVHRHMARVLSAKLVETNRLVGALNE